MSVIQDSVLIDLSYYFVILPIIHIESSTKVNILHNRSSQVLLAHSLDNFTNDSASKFKHTHYRHLVLMTSALALWNLLVPMSVLVLASNESLVKFNLTL